MPAVKECFDLMVEKGHSFQDVQMCLNEAIGELHEASKHIRNHKEYAWFYHVDSFGYIMGCDPLGVDKLTYEQLIANTVEMEIADCKLRLLALLGSVGHEFKQTAHHVFVREEMKQLDGFHHFSLCVTKIIARAWRRGHFAPVLAELAIEAIDEWCDSHHIDIDWYCEVKHNYNKTREWEK